MVQMDTKVNKVLTSPVKVGLVGTGYAAKRRAEVLLQQQRAQLMFVNGNNAENTADFCEIYGGYPLNSWQELVSHPELDLVIICTINCDHGKIAQAALERGKHVLTEYPLALTAIEGEKLLLLAEKQGKMLHVEHIELLGGVHQAIAQYLAEIEPVFYARYITLSPQSPVPRRWNYDKDKFGFPLIAALSRIHRFTDLFGTVATVSCDSRYWDAPELGYFTACLCNAQLRFNHGLMAHITYGKGDVFTKGDRIFEVQGERGVLRFEGEQGKLIKGDETIPIEVGSRRGLFAQDTLMVLDYLLEGKPLYVTPAQSLYALRVADAAYKSAQTGQTVSL